MIAASGSVETLLAIRVHDRDRQLVRRQVPRYPTFAAEEWILDDPRPAEHDAQPVHIALVQRVAGSTPIQRRAESLQTTIELRRLRFRAEQGALAHGNHRCGEIADIRGLDRAPGDRPRRVPESGLLVKARSRVDAQPLAAFRREGVQGWVRNL